MHSFASSALASNEPKINGAPSAKTIPNIFLMTRALLAIEVLSARQG